jgi:phospholipase/lecithinase/hemolysin
MKKQFVTTGFVLLSFILPVKANAANFSQIYAFGDSIVDSGNISTIYGTKFPPFPYYQGHFSNGPIWAEYLASDWGVKLTNFAYGGATTGIDNTLDDEYPELLPKLPGLTGQIDIFKTTNQTVDNQALYTIWAGANDYLNNKVQNPNEPITNLLNAVQSLASVGAKNFLIVNLPNLGSLPGTQGTLYSDGLNQLTAGHNFGLSQAVKNLNQQIPSLNVQIFDANSFLNQVINNKEKLGFTNVTDACLNIIQQPEPLPPTVTICPNFNGPNFKEYLFWDAIHPTSYAHSLIAKEIEKSIPEPSTYFGLLGIAGLGATGVIKRKRKTVNSTNLVLAGQSSHIKVES